MPGRGSIVVRMSPDVSVSSAADSQPPDLQWYVDDLIAHGVRRVHTLAWRDLDDPDAGGSEVHADTPSMARRATVASERREVFTAAQGY